MKNKEKTGYENADILGRRGFFKHLSTYFLTAGAFVAAYFFGFDREGEIKIGKMKNFNFGVPEAYGTCGIGAGCSGGGGQCGIGAGCGGGGGQCGIGAGCSGGGGQCGIGAGCGGSGGQCGIGAGCSGGGGQCGIGAGCSGS